MTIEELSKWAFRESIHGAILKVLSNARRPLIVSEITEKVLKIKKIYGKTPHKTISSILQKSSFVKRTKLGYVLLKKPIIK